MSDQELGITESKAHNPGDWYAEVVKKAKIASYAPMAGFIVTRPRGWALWETVQDRLDEWFKDTGVENASFPMLIPESFLEREKNVVEGFDPEVAWVTHGGHEELEERLAVRPTSESIIAPFMSQWIRSHRDLPMRLNQWCSVIRWEATETKPFFRTKEFHWQEGHTAHADHEDAWEETLRRLEQYRKLYEEVFAIPVLEGRKPDHDKFPGAHTTTTVEALMPDGKSVQGATSHHLGQSFAEAFEITYTDEDEVERTAHTTSWGVSWRSLGALIMTHSDDQGLVLPPTIAPTQVAIVPIWTDETKDSVLEYATEVAADLEAADVSVELDDRDERNPGFKFNEHELNGVPLRIEIGPNEVDDGEITLVHRPDSESITEDRAAVVETVERHLDTVFDKLYTAAAERLEENVREAGEPSEILGTIGRYGGYVKTHWCGDVACETVIKDEIAAEIVLQPLEDGPGIDIDASSLPDDDGSFESVDDSTDDTVDETATCGVCGEPADEIAYFAKTY